MRQETPDFKFHIWLEPLELAGVDGATLYVSAPDHIRGSVAERYLPLLRRAAVRRFDPRARVEIVATGWTRREAAEPAVEQRRPASLNPRLTFEQFVIGGGNRFAHAASLTVAELPGQAYNPLFLHGEPGLGKTHLLHAIGNYVGRYGSGLTVRYATVDEFTSEFVQAVRARDTARFRESFRCADVVQVDDVQFLAGKETTREEFFHTFNALVGSGRQLVLTSDRPPEELTKLEARLAERFRQGLVVELEAPSLEVRRAILASRARLDGHDIPRDVLEEIARCVTTSVRALEGALIRVLAYASLRQEELTPTLARLVLARLGSDRSPQCGISEILDATASELGVPRQALLARTRTPEVARARQIAMFLARELTDHSLPDIGRELGGRNHTTVLHALRRVEQSLEADTTARSAVDNLRQRLGRAV